MFHLKSNVSLLAENSGGQLLLSVSTYLGGNCVFAFFMYKGANNFGSGSAI